MYIQPVHTYVHDSDYCTVNGMILVGCGDYEE
jgi:hypothetical protein